MIGLDLAAADERSSVGDEVGVEVNFHRDAGAGIEDACGDGIKGFEIELRLKGRVGCVGCRERTGVAGEVECTRGGELGREFKRERLEKRELFDGEIDFGISERLVDGGDRRDGGAAIFDLQLIDGEIWKCAGLLLWLARLSCGGAAHGGEVPATVGCVEQIDRRRVDGEMGDAHLALQNEGKNFNSDLERFGLQERRCAEGRIVGDGDVFGDQAALPERKAEMAESDRAAQGGGEARLDGGAEGLGVDEKRNRDEGEENEGGYSCDDLEPAFLHANLTAETV